MSRILFQIKYAIENKIGRIVLESGPMNTLTTAFVTQMEEALLKVEQNPPSVLVIHSASKHFCAGADLKERREMDNLQVKLFVDRLRKMTRRLFDIPCPSICAVHGSALGGGLEIALASNIRVFQKDCKVGLPEVGLAIIPGALGTQMLTRLNYSLANEMILTGKVITGQEAFNKGLCQFTSDNAKEEALLLAESMNKKGPIALRAAKIAIQDGYGQTIDDQVQIEEACYSQTISTFDRLEGLDAFIAKRKPIYKGE